MERAVAAVFLDWAGEGEVLVWVAGDCAAEEALPDWAAGDENLAWISRRPFATRLRKEP